MMTREEHKQFVNEMCNTIKARLLNRIADVPEEWTGYELREWIKDTVKEVVPMGKLTGRRRRDYVNAVIVNNL